MKKLTRKEIKEEFIDRQIRHCRKVQDYMILLEKNRDKLPFKVKEWELVRRSFAHDVDKFSPKLVDGYMMVTEYFENKKKGLPNKLTQDDVRPHYNKHGYTQSHHVKYHSKNKTCPSNLDICEMCCDWTAHCEMEDKVDNEEYFQKVLIYQETFCKEKKDDFLKILKLLRELKKDYKLREGEL